MKKIVYFTLILLAISTIVGAVWYARFPGIPTPPPDQGSPTGLPSGTTGFATTSSSYPSNTDATLSLFLRDGSQVFVPDFTTQNQPPATSAENGYQVAGSATSSFHIIYFPYDSGILISLYAEPLSATRLSAERALRTVLGLSDAQLCGLALEVRTTMDVNSFYAGENLGLSFCPGAVTLPD